MPLIDTDLMPFGKHEGTPMEDVPAGYLDWFEENVQSDGGDAMAVLDYIGQNRVVIDKELDEKGLIPRRHVGRK